MDSSSHPRLRFFLPPPQMGSAMVEMQRGERASLLLRVRSIDPRRPCVKDHNK